MKPKYHKIQCRDRSCQGCTTPEEGARFGCSIEDPPKYQLERYLRAAHAAAHTCMGENFRFEAVQMALDLAISRFMKIVEDEDPGYHKFTCDDPTCHGCSTWAPTPPLPTYDSAIEHMKRAFPPTPKATKAIPFDPLGSWTSAPMGPLILEGPAMYERAKAIVAKATQLNNSEGLDYDARPEEFLDACMADLNRPKYLSRENLREIFERSTRRRKNFEQSGNTDDLFVGPDLTPVDTHLLLEALAHLEQTGEIPLWHDQGRHPFTYSVEHQVAYSKDRVTIYALQFSRFGEVREWTLKEACRKMAEKIKARL